MPPFVIVRNDTPVSSRASTKDRPSRRDFTPERIDEIHAACRILFQSDLNYQSGCEEVERSVPQSEDRDRLLEFIRTSQRGIIALRPHAARPKRGTPRRTSREPRAREPPAAPSGLRAAFIC